MTEKEIPKSAENTAGKQRGRPFKPGQSGNPNGKPKGSKNFSTLFDAAIKQIAKEKKLNIKDPEVQLVVKAVVEALKGNYSFYRDCMDRKFGRPKESLDLTTDGDKIYTIGPWGSGDPPHLQAKRAADLRAKRMDEGSAPRPAKVQSDSGPQESGENNSKPKRPNSSFGRL